MSGVTDVYRSAAGRFLQSAMIVDDRAALTPEDDESVPDEIADPRPRPTPSDPEATSAEAELAREQEVKDAGRGVAEENRLDARALIDQFAALGIVCGVLRPGSDVEATEGLVVTAGTRADIVLLDWHLGDSGTRAFALLDRLAEPTGSRLRLVCVYTGDGSDQVATSIGSLQGNHLVDDFRYQRGSTRIVLLFKEGAEQSGAPSDRVINVGDLPTRLIDEFASLCAGLVSAAAMSSLGAVREAMPEILGVLVPELDAAFVGQRLSQVRPDDAIDHLSELIVSELQSIIEDDAHFATIADETAVALWLDDRDDAQLTVERDALKRMNELGGSKEARTEIAASFSLFKGKKNRHPTEFVVADPAQAGLVDARLAERMVTRHLYASARLERLELGVVVESPVDGQFLVCVQPLCDSVRLATTTRMPFLPFESVTASKAFDLAIKRPAGFLHLHLTVSPSAISLVDFEPDPTQKAVLVIQGEGGDRAFADAEGRSWPLVCRLKAAHAQRIAQRLGAEFSRIGLNESEWLRLKAKG